MSRSAVARRFARLVAGLRPAARTRRACLAVQALEDRAVPANSIFIVDRATDDSDFVAVTTAGDTTTISTKEPSALLSLATIEAALVEPGIKHVIVTTAVAAGGNDGEEAGDIFWDGSAVVDQLDLTGAGSDKTLTFKTIQNPDPDTNPATGNILLSGVLFDNSTTDDTISLVFDSSEPGGSVTFGDTAGSPTVLYTAAAVRDLTVDTGGVGDFVFYYDGFATNADAAGDVSIDAGVVDISLPYPMTAAGELSVAGSVVLFALGTSLTAGGDLTVTGTDSVSAGSDPFGEKATFESTGGALTIDAPDVSLDFIVLLSSGDLTVNGSASINLTGDFMDVVESDVGNVSVTGGAISLSANLYAYSGQVTIDGDSVSGTFYIESDNLVVNGTSSVDLVNAATDVQGLTMTSTGPVSLVDCAFFFLTRGDASVTGATVTLDRTQIDTNDGDLTIKGGAITMGNDMPLGAPGDILIDGPVTLTPGMTEVINGAHGGTITFTGPVNGPGDLQVDGKTINFAQSVGAVSPLSKFVIRHGNTAIAGNVLAAGHVGIGEPLPIDFSGPEATLGIGGTITGNVFVRGIGNLAPGGLGKVGELKVQGNVTFRTDGFLTAGGDFAVDFGPGGTADKLVVVDNPGTAGITEGIVDLTAGARLGGGFGSGQLSAPSATLIDSTGQLLGQFTNAPIGAGILVGTDVITVTQYTRANGTGEMKVAPMPAMGPTVRRTEDDGTGFTVTITGRGTLVVGKDPSNRWFVVVRDSSAASKLSIVTKANASDDVITLGAGLLVNGPLASVSAAKVNIGDQFRSSGPIALVTIRDFLDFGGAGIDLGGTAANKTTIVARSIADDVNVGANLILLKVARHLGAPFFGPFDPPAVRAAAVGTVTAKSATVDIITPGKLGTVTIGGEYNGTVRAASIGRFQAVTGSASLDATGNVGAVVSTGPAGLSLDVSAAKVASVSVVGTLFGTGTPWNVTGGITKLTAASIEGVDLTAGFVGTVLAKGNLAEGISGDIRFSTFTLTGNDGPLAQNGLKSLTAKGSVQSSTFDVEGGNVGTFTVGRFLNSWLHLNYNPHDANTEAFNTGGAFGSTGFRLAAFKTTAVPLGDADHPLNWAFANSEIAADSIGTVVLSALKTDNSGTAFGIKARTAPGSVKVIQADDEDVDLNVNLEADSTEPFDTPIAGDFYFIDV